MNKSYVLSIIFCVLSFFIYFKVTQFVFNYFTISPLMNVVAILFIFFILIPAALVTGRKLSEYFTAN